MYNELDYGGTTMEDLNLNELGIVSSNGRARQKPVIENFNSQFCVWL